MISKTYYFSDSHLHKYCLLNFFLFFFYLEITLDMSTQLGWDLINTVFWELLHIIQYKPHQWPWTSLEEQQTFALYFFAEKENVKELETMQDNDQLAMRKKNMPYMSGRTSQMSARGLLLKSV